MRSDFTQLMLYRVYARFFCVDWKQKMQYISICRWSVVVGDFTGVEVKMSFGAFETHLILNLVKSPLTIT